MYRHAAITPEAFVQQLAVSYITHGYWFYVVGTVPDGKEPADVDRKLIRRYGIDISKWARARRKRSGLANVHYLRHGRFFVLLATHGLHPVFQHEANVLRDCRRAPIRFAGYSVSCRGGHAHVRIEKDTYLELKAWMLERSSFLSVEQLSVVDFDWMRTVLPSSPVKATSSSVSMPTMPPEEPCASWSSAK